MRSSIGAIPKCSGRIRRARSRLATASPSDPDASEVRAELLAEERYTVEEEEVLARVRDKLVKKDAIVVGRLDKWRILRESTEPIVVLIGGATGVGTSTLAADVARRLNIQSVIGTDSIREVLRRAISPDLLPILHKSSFEITRRSERSFPRISSSSAISLMIPSYSSMIF